jgi:hypothetical protein
MKTHLDPLADRVADWVARVETTTTNPTNAAATGQLALQGWALREELNRRGASATHLIEGVDRRLGSLPTSLVPTFVETATIKWNGLIDALDRDEENFEHVRRETRDVFFSVLDALILAEEAGTPEAERGARRLFNTVVQDLYAFEPMADVAAELQRRGQREVRLSDLLCAGVAGLFDGEIPERVAVESSDRVATDEEIEEFVPLSVWLQRGAPRDVRQAVLTLAALAKRLADIPAWYVKWSAQRLAVTVNAAARELRVRVVEGDTGATARAAMDGWQVRFGAGAGSKSATIKGGVVVLPAPEKLDAATLVFQVRQPAAGEWADVFARVGSGRDV